MEQYWEARVELISALKDGAVATFAPPILKEEEPPEESKDKELALGPIVVGSSTATLSRMARATQAALPAVGPPPPFNPLAEFVAHLEIEYGGFRQDQMQRIQDFRRENDDPSRTMYTRLARFVVESGGVFGESQLVKIFLFKIDKRLLELAPPRILLDYEGRATVAEAFAVSERCDRTLCQHDASDMVS